MRSLCAVLVAFGYIAVALCPAAQAQNASRLDEKLKQHIKRFPKPQIADETPIKPNVTTDYRASMLAYGFENKFRGYHVYSATFLAELANGKGEKQFAYIWYTYYPDSKYQSYDLEKSHQLWKLSLGEESTCKIDFRKADIATKESIDAAFQKAREQHKERAPEQASSSTEKNPTDEFYEMTPIDLPHWVPIADLVAFPHEGEQITCFALNQNGISEFTGVNKKSSTLPTQTHRTPASR